MIYDAFGNVLLCENAINVMECGAVGDGTTDDTAALQKALSAQRFTGGAVYFPSKIYKITNPLVFFSNQFLFFEPGATLLQGAGITALLLSDGGVSMGEYNGVHDSVIYGATFDGADFEVNMSLVGICHSKNVKFINCIFKNAYGSYHNLEINSSYNTLVDGCDFEGSRKTAGNGELIQIDAALSTLVYPWPTKNDSTVCKFITIQNCAFHDSPIAAAIGNHSSAAHKGIRIVNNLFDGLQSTYGIFQFASGITDIDVIGNTFNECSMKIGGIDSTGCITNNRFIDCTNIVGTMYHNNMVNGVWTA